MKRGSYHANAVVLDSFDYGESDRILTLLTREYGKLKGIAKGARRSKRRFVNNLEPPVRVRLEFFASGRGGMVRVEGATTADGFAALRGDLWMYSRACCLLELADEMTREGQSAAGVFDLLTSFLSVLAASGPGPAADAAVRFFEIKLLAESGYMPHLGGCVACSAPFGGEGGGGGVRFSSFRGGLVCPGCASEPVGAAAGLIPVSHGAAGLLVTAARFPTAKLTRLKPAPALLEEAGRLLDDFIRHQLGRELRSRIFMDKMRRSPFAGPAGGRAH